MPLLTIKQIMADSVRLATTDADPKDRYAVGAFNFSTIPEMVGLVEGAREKNAPVILMASIGAVKYIGSLELVAEAAKGIAKTYPEVPFCLHLDHATDMEQIKQAVVGTGAADKRQVAYMVRTLTQLDHDPHPDHAADALACAICHVNLSRTRALTGGEFYQQRGTGY